MCETGTWLMYYRCRFASSSPSRPVAVTVQPHYAIEKGRYAVVSFGTPYQVRGNPCAQHGAPASWPNPHEV